ncbi:MAG: MFS transporter [Psychromonas sp.]|nr:MFS transporter [Alteromonadales bacterium]MCP5078205.1 MFS transporter [Psychromonas sp.]
MSTQFPVILKPLLQAIRLDALGLFFINFIIPVIAHQKFSADGMQMGILFSLQALGTGISALLFSKRVNSGLLRAPLIQLASLIKVFAYICLYFSIVNGLYELMIIATFCLGLGSGLFWLIWQTCFAQLSLYQHRAEVFGYASKQVGMGIMVGSCFAFSLLGFAETNLCSEYIMYISMPMFAIASFISGVVGYKAVLKMQFSQLDTRKESHGFTFITVFIFSMILVGQLSGSLVAPFLEVYLLENLQIQSTSDLSLAYIPGGIASMLLAPKLGVLADKMNAAIYLACAGFVGALTTWLILQSSALWQISLLFVIDASVITSSGLVLAKLISGLAGNKMGSAFGIQGGVANFGAILGPIIGGLFWQHQGSKGPFIFSISTEVVLACCCLFILLPLLDRTRSLQV